MGHYTELIFEGMTIEKSQIEPDVLGVIDYFFGESSMPNPNKFNHPFFKCSRWNHMGCMSSFYHLAIPVTKIELMHTNQYALFMRCDLKNYDDEIKLFLDWIVPYMDEFRGWIMDEEWDKPQTFHKSFGQNQIQYNP